MKALTKVDYLHAGNLYELFKKEDDIAEMLVFIGNEGILYRCSFKISYHDLNKDEHPEESAETQNNLIITFIDDK